MNLDDEDGDGFVEIPDLDNVELMVSNNLIGSGKAKTGYGIARSEEELRALLVHAVGPERESDNLDGAKTVFEDGQRILFAVTEAHRNNYCFNTDYSISQDPEDGIVLDYTVRLLSHVQSGETGKPPAFVNSDMQSAYMFVIPENIDNVRVWVIPPNKTDNDGDYLDVYPQFDGVDKPPRPAATQDAAATSIDLATLARPTFAN